MGVPQPLSMGRALPGTARDRPLAQTSCPACPRSCPGACRTHGKGWAGTARVVANCTSTSPSSWCAFVPLPLVTPEQSLALGWCLGVMLPGGVSSFSNGIEHLLVGNTAGGPSGPWRALPGIAAGHFSPLCVQYLQHGATRGLPAPPVAPTPPTPPSVAAVWSPSKAVLHPRCLTLVSSCSLSGFPSSLHIRAWLSLVGERVSTAQIPTVAPDNPGGVGVGVQDLWWGWEPEPEACRGVSAPVCAQRGTWVRGRCGVCRGLFPRAAGSLKVPGGAWEPLHTPLLQSPYVCVTVRVTMCLRRSCPCVRPACPALCVPGLQPPAQPRCGHGVGVCPCARYRTKGEMAGKALPTPILIREMKQLLE